MRRPPSRPKSQRAGTPSEELAARRLRALEEPLSVRLRPNDGYPLLEVRNPIHRTSYLVMLPEYPTESSALCTCSDFARRGLGGCKHISAAHSWLARHSEESPAPDPAGPARVDGVWREVDRLRLGQGQAEDAPPRELARPGSALFDRPPWGRPGRPPD